MDRLTLPRLEELLVKAREIRVLVVGDIMLDVYLRGSASRISPEAPVPVVRVDDQDLALGGAANVATNVVALGASCTVVGCVGDDEAGRDLIAELSASGIDAGGVQTFAARPTTVKTRIMVRHQQVARYDREAEHEMTEAEIALLVEAIRRHVAEVDAVVLEDYNKGVLSPALIRATVKAAREAGKTVVVDPKFRHFFDYKGATVFKPNLLELKAAMLGTAKPTDKSWMERTRGELGCENLLVTLGEDGMALLTANDEFVHVPTVARSVYDVSGAGDTVTAVIAVALAAGADMVEAAVLANHAAGIEVGKAGVATVSADELIAYMGERAWQN
ncbi:MAG TPA: D-glycero-beta-D-manno-heptose-7-phosphate kinase [Longimicrobiales bacterium]|nr:D-glycero-beta-D-manno-heptose-7-phosphate kinase [Longimicrobiales bacterium]